MEVLFIYIFIFVLALLVGVFIGKLIAKNTSEKVISELEFNNKHLLNEDTSNKLIISNLTKDKTDVLEAKHAIDLKLSDKVSEIKYLEVKLNENKAEVEKLQEKFTKDFEILANRILEEKSTTFTKQNK
ncbi:MAG: DNA recombination protein RmuC, partial [Lutibacter sp.]|nr:DNA recombination protein RmuC [Lutibacter sp.]